MKIFLKINKIVNFFLGILFTVKCLGCEIKNEIICINCISKIRLAQRETEKNIMALFDYRDSLIKKAIWELKYHHKRYIGEKLGQLLYESFVEEISDIKIYSGRSIYVIPIPISNKKRKIRGYNQALSIAKGFCTESNKKILEINNKIIYKKIETIPQARISNRNRRLQNIRGVFEIKNKDKIKGRNIIIIDDVTTTGGTILEVMKILKKAGAKKIIGLTVAH